MFGMHLEQRLLGIDQNLGRKPCATAVVGYGRRRCRFIVIVVGIVKELRKILLLRWEKIQIKSVVHSEYRS